MFIRALSLCASLAVPCVALARVAHPDRFPVLPTPVPLPAFSVPAFPAAQVGQPFTFQFTNDPTPISIAVEGLPQGLSADAEGAISGTPLEAGDFEVLFTATFDGGYHPSCSQRLAVSPAIDTVSITAKVPRVAAGSGDAAVFAITREGNVSAPLAVHYTVGGSSWNGSDYFMLDGVVYFNAEQRRALVRVQPYSIRTADRGGTVRLTLSPSPSDYLLGASTRARVKIVPGNP